MRMRLDLFLELKYQSSTICGWY